MKHLAATRWFFRELGTHRPATKWDRPPGQDAGDPAGELCAPPPTARRKADASSYLCCTTLRLTASWQFALKPGKHLLIPRHHVPCRHKQSCVPQRILCLLPAHAQYQCTRCSFIPSAVFLHSQLQVVMARDWCHCQLSAFPHKPARWPANGICLSCCAKGFCISYCWQVRGRLTMHSGSTPSSACAFLLCHIV